MFPNAVAIKSNAGAYGYLRNSSAITVRYASTVTNIDRWLVLKDL